MTLINDVMHEVNEVMGLVKEDQIDDAEKVIQKDRRSFRPGCWSLGLDG